MSKPKFYYYHVLGRGQFVLALLNYLKIEFEYIHFRGSIPEDVKSLSTFSTVPIYIDDDIKICQTHAITRYISEKNGFLGENIVERAKANEIIDSFWDGLNIVFKYIFFDGDKSAINIEKYLNIYEMKLNENQFIAGGNNYTFADLGVYVLYNYVKRYGLVKEFYPKIENLKNHFDSLPQMKQYLEMLEFAK